MNMDSLPDNEPPLPQMIDAFDYMVTRSRFRWHSPICYNGLQYSIDLQQGEVALSETCPSEPGNPVTCSMSSLQFDVFKDICPC